MSNNNSSLKDLISHAKAYGFIFQSSEIYDGMGAVYDYGPNGVELKNNIKNYWWKSMVNMNKNIVGIDSAIFMNPKTWKASGHIDAFNDPLVDNKDSKKRYRADILIENHIEKIVTKNNKEILKAKKKFGDNFDKDQFVATNAKVIERNKKIINIQKSLNVLLETDDLKGVKELIENLNIKCPISGTSNWTDVRQFNLMFKTNLGSTAENTSDLFLRPETAQGIFVNFLNVQKSSRMKIPFGIAQIGKAFRNEIIARQFIFRMREFEQMEMQFFIPPGTQKQYYEDWKKKRLNWHISLGMGKENYRFHDHEKLAHYADAACDIEFNFPFGFKELEGIHSRTDFDLGNHQKYTGKKIQYFDSELNESYVPYVVETSIGLDRMFLSVFCNSLIEEKLEDGSLRTVLKIPKELAPNKVAILPLLKKDNLPEMAKEIFKKFRSEIKSVYDDKDAIGRRYRRQDAIGTPFCITIDHKSIEDQTVTIRERDSMKQKRVKIEKALNEITQKVSITNILKTL